MQGRIVRVLAVSAAGLAGCDTATRRDSLEVVVEGIRADLEAPGAIVALGLPDGSTRVVATGLADLESARPMRADDAYFLGSVSKVYTATVVMRLAEEGVLSLDDPLSRFLPEFPRAGE